MRPAGMRPAGMRPYEADDPIDYIDAADWSADVADLVCEYSAVLRLGVRLLFSERSLAVGGIVEAGVALPDGAVPWQDGVSSALAAQFGPGTPPVLDEQVAVGYEIEPPLEPHVVTLPISNRRARRLLEHPELAMPLKEDLARQLAVRFDRTFLERIEDSEDLAGKPEEVAPKMTRRVMGRSENTGSGRQLAHVGSSGWVIHPRTLDHLTWGSKLPERRLLEFDGGDTGMLGGSAFVASLSAQTGGDGPIALSFSSDWSQGYILATAGLVSVDLSSDAAFDQDEVVVRAVTSLGAMITNQSCFVQRRLARAP